MINLLTREAWIDSLSEDKVVEYFDNFGSTFQVPELISFSLIRDFGKGVLFPVSGHFNRFVGYDFFSGIGISSDGPSYIEGVLDLDKNSLRMVEFYEALHSLGNWTEYNVNKDDKGNWKGTVLYNWRGEQTLEGNVEVHSLENKFVNESLGGRGHHNIFNHPKIREKINEFWNNLKGEGFIIPEQYYSREEVNNLYLMNGEKDDLPF